MNNDSPTANGEFVAFATQFWRERGGHLTFVRRVICECIIKQESVFTSEHLWRDCRKVDNGISLASVYRTIVDLVSAGLLREIARPNEQRLFVRNDTTSAEKGFLICKNCERVIPLEDDCLALREGAAIRSLGFQTKGMRLLIEADCQELKTCGNCEHNTSKDQGAPIHPQQ